MFPFSFDYVLILIAALLISLFLTPIVRCLAFKTGTGDEPNARRVNKDTMPSSGGLEIFISFFVTILILMPKVSESILIDKQSYYTY
ncbi:undecaprenyl/decaprenyl-phosphate alpha-N-acetylglucosaminyl 1-phosphate transferase, partial [Streptococcus porcinus]